MEFEDLVRCPNSVQGLSMSKICPMFVQCFSELEVGRPGMPQAGLKWASGGPQVGSRWATGGLQVGHLIAV